MTRLKLAELASVMGVLILGFGLGAYFNELASTASIAIIIAGLIIHLPAMVVKHRLEKTWIHQNASFPAWVNMIYWICWFAVLLLIAYLWYRKS